MATSDWRQIPAVMEWVEDVAIKADGKPFSVLDVGCGWGRYGVLVKCSWPEARVTGVDVLPERCIYQQAYTGVYTAYLPDSPIAPDRFDVVLFLDVLEHLAPDDAVRALQWCRKHGPVILSTPNGFMKQEGDTEYDHHRSGWSEDELYELGATDVVVVPSRDRHPVPHGLGQLVARFP